MRFAVLVLIFTLFIGGCSGFERGNVTKFELERADADARYFKYKAVADKWQYPLDDDGEKMRIEWLEQWLEDSGMAGKKYEIVSREVVQRYGQVHDVYYMIKVPR